MKTRLSLFLLCALLVSQVSAAADSHYQKIKKSARSKTVLVSGRYYEDVEETGCENFDKNKVDDSFYKTLTVVAHYPQSDVVVFANDEGNEFQIHHYDVDVTQLKKSSVGSKVRVAYVIAKNQGSGWQGFSLLCKGLPHSRVPQGDCSPDWTTFAFNVCDHK